MSVSLQDNSAASKKRAAFTDLLELRKKMLRLIRNLCKKNDLRL